MKLTDNVHWDTTNADEEKNIRPHNIAVQWKWISEYYKCTLVKLLLQPPVFIITFISQKLQVTQKQCTK